MKFASYLISSLILLSCSSKNDISKEEVKPEHEPKLSFSKLPIKNIDQSSLDVLGKFELDKYINDVGVELIGKYFGQNLYVHSYEYDTVVNKTPIFFIYQCIGSKNNAVVSQQMLAHFNSWINDLIEIAKIQSFNALYSIAFDEIKLKDNCLIYSRAERQFTGGAGEFYNSTRYKLDSVSLSKLVNDFNNYKSDSDFLKRNLISETSH